MLTLISHGGRPLSVSRSWTQRPLFVVETRLIILPPHPCLFSNDAETTLARKRTRSCPLFKKSRCRSPVLRFPPSTWPRGELGRLLSAPSAAHSARRRRCERRRIPRCKQKSLPLFGTNGMWGSDGKGSELWWHVAAKSTTKARGNTRAQVPSAGEGIAPHQESLMNSDRFHLRGRHRVPGLTAAFHRFFFFLFIPVFFFHPYPSSFNHGYVQHCWSLLFSACFWNSPEWSRWMNFLCR